MGDPARQQLPQDDRQHQATADTAPETLPGFHRADRRCQLVPAPGLAGKIGADIRNHDHDHHHHQHQPAAGKAEQEHRRGPGRREDQQAHEAAHGHAAPEHCARGIAANPQQGERPPQAGEAEDRLYLLAGRLVTQAAVAVARRQHGQRDEDVQDPGSG